LYLERLRSNDARVRAAAITALGRLGSTADLAVLLDAYDVAVRDTETVAATAAVNALGALQRDGTPVMNAFFTRFEAHPDAAVRSLVERRLGRAWDWEEVPPTARGAAFYEDVVRRLVAPVLARDSVPVLVFDGPSGRIEVALAASDAPLTVHNIVTLIESGYFDEGGDPDTRRWHRVVPNFVLQDGEPNGDGSGGTGYAIRDEINRLRYTRGALGMALSGPDTGGSQFFIAHSPQPHLDGGYTVFGYVVNGMDAADRVVQDDRVGSMRVEWR
jgi:cyclophilin family peptidyl-prolyl cis-trans isomerase